MTTPGDFGHTVTGLARACHPQPTAVVTGIACALAVAAGLRPATCALIGVAVLAGQLSVGWSNDAVDAGRDITLGRTGKPVVDGAVSANTVRAAAAIALACCVPLSLAVGLLAGAVHLVGVAAAWSYNLGVKATWASPLPFAVGFASLPSFVTLALPGHPWPAWWVVAAGALLGVGAHLANVLPDIAGDLATGVRGGPQRLGPRVLRMVLPVPLLVAAVLLVVGPPGPVRWIGWALLAASASLTVAGAALGGRRPSMPFLASMGAAVADVVLLLNHAAALAA